VLHGSVLRRLALGSWPFAVLFAVGCGEETVPIISGENAAPGATGTSAAPDASTAIGESMTSPDPTLPPGRKE
jgi:hypothetical protein